MDSYSKAAVERAMKVQEVILRATTALSATIESYSGQAATRSWFKASKCSNSSESVSVSGQPWAAITAASSLRCDSASQPGQACGMQRTFSDRCRWEYDVSQPGWQPGNPGYFKSEAVAYPSELFP